MNPKYSTDQAPVTKKSTILKTFSVENRKRKIWIGTYFILLAIFLIVYFALKVNTFNILGSYQPILQKLALAFFLAVAILLLSKLAESVIAKKSHTAAIRYNLLRFVKLLALLLIVLVFISVLFVNWYTAAVSLGLISLLLGFALQTPISSFIGWLYIVIRAPYLVGDRIQVGSFTGDVAEINYLDTTLLEFAGDYLTNDLPSGRLIRFPNSMILQSEVYNYSWKKFDFIWNEIPFHIAYESDLKFVEDTMRSVAKKVLGERMNEHIEDFKRIIQQSPIDELEIKEYPYICFHTNANTWLEASIIYLVEPKQAATKRSLLIRNIVAELLKMPDRVMFPKSNSR
ncbi:MAG: mechanosensitive ion channel domain-containing protein [Chitinophagales bacterium]